MIEVVKKGAGKAKKSFLSNLRVSDFFKLEPNLEEMGELNALGLGHEQQDADE